MSSPITSSSFSEQEILDFFSEKINDLPGDTAKVISVMENILKGTPQLSLTGGLADRVTELQEMFARPAELSKGMNIFAIQSLREKMKGLIERILEIKIQSLTAKQKCQKILIEISNSQISTFVDTVEGFYHQALLDGKPYQEALTFSLGKGMVRSVINLPSSDEVAANVELQARIEANPDFQPYKCPLTFNLVGSDAVYLRQRVDVEGNPFERYHEQVIMDWIRRNPTDPVTKEVRTLDDIKPDYKAREFVEKKLFSLLYPELIPEKTGVAASVKSLHSKAFLLALAAAYPLIKKQYAEALSQLGDPHAVIAAIESSAKETVSRFTRIVEEMNWEGEEVVSPCFPVIKEFLRESEKKLTTENLEEIRAEFLRKLGTFITFFHEIGSFQLTPRSEENALKKAGDAIEKGASFEAVMELFELDVNSVMEGAEIREAFPGCLLGKVEWDTHLGFVENLPLPEGILDILNQPCPRTPSKKVGETHILVLIPMTVNGQPVTLNRLGSLVKSRGHFQDTDSGYKCMTSLVATEYGNMQVDSSHWILMTKGILPESKNKCYREQRSLVKAFIRTSRASYEVPGVLDATVCVVMNYLASPSRAHLFGDDPWIFTRCQETIRKSRRKTLVIVVGFSPDGPIVHHDSGTALSNCGIAALRKF